jgi:hypothetical protein
MTVVVYIWVHKVYLELVESINISNIRDHQGYRKPRGIGGGFSGVGVRV